METTKEDIQLSSWNLSSHVINQIGYLLQCASMKFISGQIQSAYFITEEIRNFICCDLNEEETKKLNDYELKISNLYSKYKKYTRKLQSEGELSFEDNKEMIITKNLHYRETKKYRMYIMQLLSKYGYLISKKEDSTKMF